DQQREVDILALGAIFFRVGLDRGHLVFEQHLGFEQQAPDQGALAVIHAAAGNEAQQALVLVAAQVFADVGGDEIGYMGHFRSTPPAFSFPWTRPNRGRSPAPVVPTFWSAASPG